MTLSDLSIETNKSERQSKVTQLSFLQSIIYPSNRSGKLYLSSVSFPSLPVNYSELNSSHCIDGDMPITSTHNRVHIPLIFSTRSSIWYGNDSEEFISTCKPVLVTTSSAWFDSGQRRPGGEVPFTIWLCQQNNRSSKVSCLLSKMIPFISQIHSCQAERLACWLAVSDSAALLRESSPNAFFLSVLQESMCSFRATNTKRRGRTLYPALYTLTPLEPGIYFYFSATQNPIPGLRRSNPDTTRPPTTACTKAEVCLLAVRGSKPRCWTSCTLIRTGHRFLQSWSSTKGFAHKLRQPVCSVTVRPSAAASKQCSATSWLHIVSEWPACFSTLKRASSLRCCLLSSSSQGNPEEWSFQRNSWAHCQRFCCLNLNEVYKRDLKTFSKVFGSFYFFFKSILVFATVSLIILTFYRLVNSLLRLPRILWHTWQLEAKLMLERT